MKLAHICAALALACVAFFIPTDAFAQISSAAAESDSTFIHVPWGEYASELLITGAGLAGWLIGRAVGLLPGPAQLAIKLIKLDQVAVRSIEAAAFELADQIKKEGYSVNVRNAMLARAINGFQANARQLAHEFQESLTVKLKARVEEYIASKQAT